jgi:hypothetical protein
MTKNIPGELNLRMLDLFSGLGGASRAMRERGWDVITVDIEPRFNPSIIADISTYHYEGKLPVDLVWASPPCTEFSKDSLPRSWACNRNNPPKPDTALTEAAMRVIEEVKPRWWVIENVRGAVKHFRPILGAPVKRVGSRYLWGVFPDFDCPPVYGKWRLPPSPDRAALRSLIPRELSEALCLACEQFMSE